MLFHEFNDTVFIMHCEIYKSSKKDEMYLYVARTAQVNTDSLNADQAESEFDPLSVMPEAMRAAFGRATFVMKLELSQDRKLARVNVLHVMDALENNGYFIQMPPEGLINPNAVAPEGLRGA